MRNLTGEVASDPQQTRAALAAFEAGHISEAARLLDALPPDTVLTDYESRMRRQIEGWKRLLSEAPEIPPRQPMAYEPAPRTALYVTASCQPFHVTGYSVRTHELLRGTSLTGWKVCCMARPGYPWDRWDALAKPARSPARHDGVDYHLTGGVSLSAMSPDVYLSTAAVLIESAARGMRPAVIHAASNHMTALPSLIAARRLGVPFVYEVRGLWELFFGLGKPGWKESERFLLAKRLETLAARSADAVFTLTRQLAEQLQERNVPASRIRLLPNGGDPALHRSVARDRGLVAELGLDPSVLTIGYAGALKSYEGLDDLLEAMAQLRGAGRRVQAVIVGDGDQIESLRARSAELGLDDAVRFTGRLAPAAAHAQLRSTDIAVLPRKRTEVGDIVSPLKPFEIMALEMPLVMSNVAALADIAEESGDAALLHEPSDAGSLAAQIARLMDEPDLRRDLGARGREFVEKKRSWAQIAGTMTAAYDALAEGTNSLPGSRARRLRLRLLPLAGLFRKPSRRAADMALITASGLFDAEWYRQRYPDVLGEPLSHYLEAGAHEGRNPGPGFDGRWYLQANPDVAASGINPLLHYLLHGQNEGRAPRQYRREIDPRFALVPRTLPGGSSYRWVLHGLFPSRPRSGSRALFIAGTDPDAHAAAKTTLRFFRPEGSVWRSQPTVDHVAIGVLDRAASPVIKSVNRLGGALEDLSRDRRYALITAAVPAANWDVPLRDLARLEALLAEGGHVVLRLPADEAIPRDIQISAFAGQLRASSRKLEVIDQAFVPTPFEALGLVPVVREGVTVAGSHWLILGRRRGFVTAREHLPNLTEAILGSDWDQVGELIERADRLSPSFEQALEWLRPLAPNLSATVVLLEKGGRRASALALRIAAYRLDPETERFAVEAIAHLRVAERFDAAGKIVEEAKKRFGNSLGVRLQEALLYAASGRADEAIEVLWDCTRALPGYSASLRRSMAVILRGFARECQRAGIETKHPRPLLVPEVAEAYNADPNGFAARWEANPFAALMRQDAKKRRIARKAAREVAGNQVAPGKRIRILVLTSDNWQFLINLLGHVESHDTEVEIRTFDFAFLEQSWSKEHLHELFAPVSQGLKPEQVWLRAAKDDLTLAELVEWSDVVFCEWAGTHAIWLSRFLPPEKRLVVRLHSFEAFSPLPFFIDFGGVDGIIYVADHIRQFTEIQFRPSSFEAASAVLPNFNSLLHFARPKGPDAGRTLAMVGYSNANKHPLMAAEILAKLRQHDPKWRLRLYGHSWQPESLTESEFAYHDRFWSYVRANELTESVELRPYTKDIPGALQDVGFILSCSWREGTHEAVLEGMATGCVPVIRRWPMVSQYGAPESIYPGIPCFDTVEQAAEIVLTASRDFEKWSQEAVDYARARFDIDSVFPRFVSFMRQVASEQEGGETCGRD